MGCQGIKRELSSSVSAFHWILREGLPLQAVVIDDWSTFWYESIFIVRAFIWANVPSRNVCPLQLVKIRILFMLLFLED